MNKRYRIKIIIVIVAIFTLSGCQSVSQVKTLESEKEKIIEQKEGPQLIKIGIISDIHKCTNREFDKRLNL